MRSFSVRLDSLNESQRSVEAVIATENPVLVMDLDRWEPVLEVLRMDGLKTPMGTRVPLCDTHQRYSTQTQVGSTELLRVEGASLIGRNIFSRAAGVEDTWIKVKEGHIRDNSVGYRVENAVLIEAGKTAQINGTNYAAPADQPLRVVTEWKIRENSICPVGADPAAKNRQEKKQNDLHANANERENQPVRRIDMDFEKWLQERGYDPKALSAEQRDLLRKTYDHDVAQRAAAEAARTQAVQQTTGQTQAAENKTADRAAIAEEAVRAELQRQSDIRTLAGEDIPAEVVAECIEKRVTVEQAQARFLQEMRNKNKPVTGIPAVMVRDDSMTAQRMTDAFLLRAGWEDLVLREENGPQRANQAERFMDISIVDACRMAIAMSGKTPPWNRDELIRMAFSTTTLPYVLGAVANKGMMKGYNAAPATWQSWCSVTTASDFKTMTKTRVTDMGDLEELGIGGEVKYGGAEEEYEQYSIGTYAKNFGLDRQQIINDDLGAFTLTPQRLGAKAMARLSKLIYTHLLANGNMADGAALFVSGHANLNTSAALAAATLATAIKTFMNQTGKDGEPIDLRPAVLLVPTSLDNTARELVESPALIITGSTDAARGAKNILANKGLTVTSEPRLENSAYTGYSATSWYLMGDPNECDNIQVAFLNGKQSPTIETVDPGPYYLGMIWRVYFDFGCKALDYRTMVKNTA